MNIDRATLDRELAAARAQQQQFVRLLEQAVGAEKALMKMLEIMDRPAGRPFDADKEEAAKTVAGWHPEYDVAYPVEGRSNGAAQ